MSKVEPIRTIKATPLISPVDLHVVDPSTKMSIRLKGGHERMVPPAFVGLALAAGALPQVVYAQQDYGRYVLLDGTVHGDVIEVADPNMVPMPERKRDEDQPKREPMELTSPPTVDEILKAIQTVLDKVAQYPENRGKFLAADGKPKVPALEEVLGRDITASMRDEAWAAMTSSAD